MNLKILLTCVLTPCLLFSQNFDEAIKQICINKSSHFHKAHEFFKQKNNDSAYYYSSQAYLSIKPDFKPKHLYYLHYIFGASASSKKFYSLAEDKLKQIPKSFQYYYKVNFSLGIILFETKRYAEALTHFETCLNSKKQDLDLKKLYHNIGVCHMHLKSYSKAEIFLNKKLKIVLKEKDTSSIIHANINLANVYYEQYKDHQAIPLFKKAYDLATLYNDLNLKLTTTQNMAVVKRNSEQFKKSASYYAQAIALKDSIWNNDKISLLVEKDKQFAIKQKEQEVQLLTKLSRLHRNQRNGLFFGVLVFVLFSIGLLYLYQQTKKQKIALKKLNQLKNYLFSVVSHDLRSHINLLITKSNTLTHLLEQNKFEKAHSLSQENYSLSKNTSHVINNVLNWTLKENNQLEYSPENHPIEILIQSVLFDFKNILKFNDIIVNFTNKSQAIVHVDKELFKIIFRNIIDNAIKYSPKKSEISISVTKLNLTLCKIDVKDMGNGMPTDVLNQINSSETLTYNKINRSQNLGLGLVLCKGFTLKNKGQIIFKNGDAPKKGLQVTLHFPLAS